MTTLTQLAGQCQNALDDASAATWSQSLIEEFCNHAIREYSVHFPRTRIGTVSLTSGQRQYNLPADFIDMIRVEWPLSQEPPSYLQRADHRQAAFWDAEGLYDIIRHTDASDPDELLLAEEPVNEEDVQILYLAAHDASLSSADTITVPSRHENLLVAHVVWQAYRHLQSGEQQSPTSNSSLLMSQLAANVDRAERAYRRFLEEAKAAEHRTAVIQWQMDGWDRIY